jgi:hypothetical protein
MLGAARLRFGIDWSLHFRRPPLFRRNRAQALYAASWPSACRCRARRRVAVDVVRALGARRARARELRRA